MLKSLSDHSRRRESSRDTDSYNIRALLQKRPIIFRLYIDRSCGGQSPIKETTFFEVVGSIKLQVSFAKEPYKRDNILYMTAH